MWFLGLLNKDLLTKVAGSWKLIVIGLLSSIVLYQNFSDTRFFLWSETIPSLEKRLDAAVIAVNVCKAGNDKLSNAIDTHNGIVEDWKKISDDLEADVATLEDELIKKRVKTVTVVKTILQEATPKDCNAAIDYLRDGRKDLTWEE